MKFHISKMNTGKKEEGFTLVETLIAVSVLALVVGGAFTAAQQGISSSIYSKDQVAAFYLAQEAVEQIRNLRDENALQGRGWLYGIAENQSDPCYYGKTCKVDALNSTTPLSTCSGGSGSCPALRENTTNGFFGYDAAWTPTVYKREVSLTQINSEEVAITVRVNWSKGIITRQFVARENILNWQ